MAILFKMVLAGDGGVGKTTLRMRYMGRPFVSTYMTTIGADFAVKDVVIDGKPFRIQIWDLAGQTKFDSVRKNYYSGILGALVLFDVTKPLSFVNLKNWIEEIWNHNGKGIIPIVILGNKADLRDQFPYSITDEIAENSCAILSQQTKLYGFEVKYLPTSAKTGQNVAKAFEIIAKLSSEYLSLGNS